MVLPRAGLAVLAAGAALAGLLWGASAVRGLLGRADAADSLARVAQTALADARTAHRRELGALHRWSQQESVKARAALSSSAQARRRAVQQGDSVATLLAALKARDSAGHLLPLDPRFPLDSGQVAASCEARYALRTREALTLYGSVQDCEAGAALALLRGDSLERRLVLDSARSDGLTARQDSLWRVRYDAKPCTRDWLLVRPPCWVQDVVIGTGGLAAGLLAR